jgi:hypothetical protein
MANMLLPDPRFRSPTAVDGKSDFRDDNIYSSILLQHGGAGQQKVFTIPQGQAIPALRGAGIAASTNAWQTTYTETTTNLSKAGELGSGIGDAAIRSIGISLETAAVTASTGAARAWGATQFEVSDVLSKCFFQLKVASKTQITGPIFTFPSAGGSFGSISTTGNAATAGVVSNGWPGSYKRLKIPVPVARNDTLEGVFGVAGGSSLAFSVTSADGQPSLLWVVLTANVAGDVR